MYCVGDKVVHPMHGAGTVEEIKEMEIVGKKRQYYVVRFAIGNMVTNVPLESVDSIGIRPIIDKQEAKKVLQCFRDAVVEGDDNWNKRQRDNLVKVKSGDIYQVLVVVKELMYRDRLKGLSTSERKTLGSAKQIVVSELVLSEVADISDIESIMNDTVEALV
ncbi:MAG: CarD family transcriptional regulator [Oscillospiraceae bacterium]|nr:CarD family transcriptional regulator [Oscillospiraceae bacterium]